MSVIGLLNEWAIASGTTSLGYKLDAAGDVHATSFPASSDLRLKTNIAPLTNVLQKLEKFDWNEEYKQLGKATTGRQIGVIAQELKRNFQSLQLHGEMKATGQLTMEG